MKRNSTLPLEALAEEIRWLTNTESLRYCRYCAPHDNGLNEPACLCSFKQCKCHHKPNVRLVKPR